METFNMPQIAESRELVTDEPHAGGHTECTLSIIAGDLKNHRNLCPA